MAAKDVEKLLRGRRKALEKNDIQEAASICNTIGIYYTERGHYRKALQYHREELTLSESINDELGTAVGHRKVGECLADMNQFPEALNEQEQYLNIAESLNSKEEIQRAYATIGRIWYMRYKAEAIEKIRGAKYLDKATQAFNFGLEACNDLEGIVQLKELTEMRARLYLNLGLVAEELNDYSTAEERYQHACILAKESGCNELVWQILINLGEFLMNVSLPNRALIPLEDSLKYADMSKNKQHRADSLLQIAMVHIHLVDLKSAKVYLKCALKLNVWADEEYQSVVKKYKVVCKVINLLNEAASSQLPDRLKYYDMLGDICSNKELQFYSAAIKYYKTELELAQNHGLETKQISKIIFSLAETHLDNGQYDEALSYYRQELDIWQGQPAEEAVSWVNIARVHESCGNVTDALEAYSTALKLASSVSAYKVLGDAYRSLIAFCESLSELKNELEIREKELSDLIEIHPEAKESMKQENSQEATPLNFQDVNDELVLSSSASEDEEEYALIDHTLQTRKLRGVAVCKKAKISKRNEKGETPLHIAAIEGHVTRVKQLIEDDADVHVQDYCGWTPLHEACNHGNLDVVKCLLDHGANIDDVGGENCNRTTSLMDAACNGHVDVVSLLIERGADLSIKNTDGKTVYCLIQDYILSHRDIDECYLAVKDLLYQAMIGQGLQKLICEAKQKSKNDYIEDDPDSTTCPENDVPALVSMSPMEEDYPIIDNWLLDDMEPPMKRTRNDDRSTQQIFREIDSNRTCTSKRDKSNPNQSNRRGETSQSNKSQRRGPSQSNRSRRGPSQFNRSLRSRNGPSQSSSFLQYFSDEDNISVNEEIEEDWVTADSSEVIVDSYCRPTVELTQSTITPFQSILRVKVKLEDSAYLIPCPCQLDNGDRTMVKWLMDETIERYFLQHGRKPLVTLTTSEGALLCPTDLLSHVIQDGDEIIGIVKHWETPHLDEHYQNICQHLKAGVNCNVLKLFQNSPSNISSLNFTNFGLQARHGSALSHTLLAQSSLTSINFSGNHLGDSFIAHLVDLLNNLHSLYDLDLSCTGLTHHGIANLTHSSLLPTSSFQYPLLSLKLNHNDLGSSCGSSLSLFLSRLLKLTRLSLNECGLTSYIFESHTGLVRTLESLTHLEELSIAYNKLNNSINLLSSLKLTSLNIESSTTSPLQIKLPVTITHANLSCCTVTHDFPFISSLSELHSLNLSGSFSDINSIENLTSCLAQFKRLSWLDLSANSCITNNECSMVLVGCAQISAIHQILFMNCSLCSPLPESFIECVNKTSINEFNILYNDISSVDKQRLLTQCKCNVFC